MGNVSRRSFVKGAALGMAGSMAGGVTASAFASSQSGIAWDYEADVVVIGAGGAGLPAALKALDEGASVIVVEANWDCGGHTAVSEGNMHSGAGTEIQKKYGIEDSTDQYYIDHTYGGLVVSRYNDRDYIRAIADNMVEAYDFVQSKGVIVADSAPTFSGTSRFDPDKEGKNGSNCDTVPRQTVPDATVENWETYRGKQEAGIALTRPMERSAREAGARFLMNYHMDELIREETHSAKCSASRHPTLPTCSRAKTNRLAT